MQAYLVLPPLPATVVPGLVAEAIAFLRRTALPIEPRRLRLEPGTPEAVAPARKPRAGQGELFAAPGE